MISLDEAVQPDWIIQSSIIPPGVVDGNTITWEINEVFEPGDSMTLSYTLRVPRSAFGQIENLVTATPEEGEPFTDESTVMVSCTTPVTGIFDSTRSKVVAGVLMIIISGAYLAFEKFDIISVNALHSAKGGINKRYGKEAKVSKSRKRFERDW
ncbi:MAG: hypothetical protein QY318_01300 [Candidatus Dojkabacteria bacterium]|nr:MAG: hypothetical protein QY318_01300 [Candidatus Dojkabacteria bacterium]